MTCLPFYFSVMNHRSGVRMSLVKPLRSTAVLLAAGLLLTACGNNNDSQSDTPQAKQEVVVYSSRNEQLITPLFDASEAETGVHVRFRTDSEGPLMARIEAEGSNTPADLLLTVDAGNLWQAANMDLLRSIESDVLEEN